MHWWCPGLSSGPEVWTKDLYPPDLRQKYLCLDFFMISNSRAPGSPHYIWEFRDLENSLNELIGLICLTHLHFKCQLNRCQASQLTSNCLFEGGGMLRF